MKNPVATHSVISPATRLAYYRTLLESMFVRLIADRQYSRAEQVLLACVYCDLAMHPVLMPSAWRRAVEDTVSAIMALVKDFIGQEKEGTHGFAHPRKARKPRR